MRARESYYDIPAGCICMGDGMMGMRCEAPKHARMTSAAARAMLGKIAEKSDDPDTQTACIIQTFLGCRTLATSANQLATSVTNSASRTSRPDKYLFVMHAEARLIAQSAARAVGLTGQVMYLNWFPCAPCASLIVEARIAVLIADRQKYEARKDDPRYGFAAAMEILTEGGVSVEWLEADCVCPSECDCQSPDTEPALVSNHCPVHNLYPLRIGECEADRHRNGAGV